MVEFYKTKLNGLTILFERRNLPIATIMIATKLGAAYEVEKEKGIAHFTEHMLFKGSKKRTQKEISSSIEKAGGILNGFTAEQVTAFWCKIPSKKASLGMEILFDMFANPKFDRKELEKEKEVIVAEINRKHDTPKHFLFDKVKELLYRKPFALSILGSEGTVRAMTRNNLVRWHSYYNRENCIVTVVGKADLEEIKKFTNQIKSRTFYFPNLKIASLKRNLEFIEKRENIDQAHLAMAFCVPKLSDKGRYAAELFNTILGSGMSSRLFQEIREKRGLAYEIKSFVESEKDYGYCVIYTGTSKKNIKKIKELVLQEIKKLKNLELKDLEEAKEQCIGNWELELEDSLKTATWLTLQEIATRAEDFYDYYKKISAVKLEEVRAIAKIRNYVFAAIVPKD